MAMRIWTRTFSFILLLSVTAAQLNIDTSCINSVKDTVVADCNLQHIVDDAEKVADTPDRIISTICDHSSEVKSSLQCVVQKTQHCLPDVTLPLTTLTNFVNDVCKYRKDIKLSCFMDLQNSGGVCQDSDPTSCSKLADLFTCAKDMLKPCGCITSKLVLELLEDVVKVAYKVAEGDRCQNTLSSLPHVQCDPNDPLTFAGHGWSVHHGHGVFVFVLSFLLTAILAS